MPAKKNNSVTIIIIIIVIALLVLVVLKIKVGMEKQPLPINRADMELDQVVESDTTESINDSLNNIDVDTSVDADLQSVDQELNNL